MEKNNEQGKGWEDIAIDGLEPIEEADEDSGETMTETARNTIADIFIIVEAWKILAPLKGKAAGPVDPDLQNALQHLEKGNASYEIKINALFTGLSGQDLEEAEALSPDQIEELKTFFYRLDEFIFEGKKEDPDATIGRLIVKFVYLEKPKRTEEESVSDLLQEAEKVSSKSRHLTLLNGNLINRITDIRKNGIINAGEGNITFKNSPKTTFSVKLEYNLPDVNIQYPGGRMLPYDRTLSDSIATAFTNAGPGVRELFIKIEDMHRGMTGPDKRATEKDKVGIRRAMNRGRRLLVGANLTAACRRCGIVSPTTEVIYDENFYMCKHWYIRDPNNGKKVEGYLFKERPVALRMCELTNQLFTIPNKYLDIKKVKDGEITGESLATNEKRAEIVHYLFLRIEQMKRKKKNKQRMKPSDYKITIQSIFENMGNENPTPKEKSTDIKYLRAVLDYEAAAGYIKSYKLNKEGKSIESITIDLAE